MDFVNGGGGDDTLILGAGDIASGGSGADDLVLTNDTDGGSPIQIIDFEDDDSLILIWDDESQPPQLDIEQDADNPDQQHLLANGQMIATLCHADQIDLSDITVLSPQQAALLPPT